MNCPPSTPFRKYRIIAERNNNNSETSQWKDNPASTGSGTSALLSSLIDNGQARPNVIGKPALLSSLIDSGQARPNVIGAVS